MERVWPLTAGAAAVAVLALASGCNGTKFGKGDAQPWTPPVGVPTAPLSLTAKPETSPIVQASGTMTSHLPWSKGGAKVPAVNITTLWRNKIDYLPDPSKNGQTNPGVVGQVFFFGPNDQFTEANGKLTIALYDETPRPAGQPAATPEGWEFDKETLRKLRTSDERFGVCYGLFLPWPTYRPDITRIRIAVRYDPEQGFPLYATETRITFDNTGSGTSGPVWSNQVITSGASSVDGSPSLGGPAPVNSLWAGGLDRAAAGEFDAFGGLVWCDAAGTAELRCAGPGRPRNFRGPRQPGQPRGVATSRADATGRVKSPPNPPPPSLRGKGEKRVSVGGVGRAAAVCLLLPLPSEGRGPGG